MLRHLSLHDFVIVRELDVDFAGGFSVLTGETGAGKSILIDALQLALGGRGDAAGGARGRTRAPTSPPPSTPPRHFKPGWTKPASCRADDPTTLLVRRSIDAQGRSRAWINGVPTPP